MYRRANSAWFLPRRRRLGNGVDLDPRDEEAFLESLTVVAIIAVLAGQAFESYRPALAKATMAEAASLMVAHRTAIATELAVTGQLPEAVPPRGGRPSAEGRYFGTVQWQDQEIVLPLRPEAEANIAESDSALDPPPLTLSFRVARSTEIGRPLILCGLAEAPAGFEAPPARHTTVPEQYLPFFCRN